jgi:calpain-15
LVYFYVNGLKTPVMIDDYLPVDSDGEVVFAKSKTQELWPALIEKAWAKLHGSYARVEIGIPYRAYS